MKKIVDDHEGELIIKNGIHDNAIVEIILPTNLKNKNMLLGLVRKKELT